MTWGSVLKQLDLPLPQGVAAGNSIRAREVEDPYFRHILSAASLC